MKRISVKKGERTPILHIVSDSIPQSVLFGARPLEGDEPVGGTVEVERRTLLGRRAPITYALQPENRIRKGFWDTGFKIFVTSDRDAEIEFRTRHFTANWLLLTLGTMLLLGLAAGLWAYYAGGGQ